jgi:hypothetical protein
MQASLQRLKNDVLLALIEKALNLDEPDIEKATEAYDEIIRRDKDRNVRKAKETFAHAISSEIVAELQIDLSPANLDQPQPSVKDIASQAIKSGASFG